MEVIVRPNAEQAAELVARLIAARLRSKPELVLGLATGRTMERVYDRLVASQGKEAPDFSRCCTFNLDEYIGVPAEDDHSCRYYMNHHLFCRINIDLANTHVPDGMAADLRAESTRYEQLIRQLGEWQEFRA
jgi:glucosamine-6-phosphate deaminase